MQVTYELTRKDYWKNGLWLNLHMTSVRNWNIVAVLIVLVIFVHNMPKDKGFLYEFIYLIILSFLFMLLIFMLQIIYFVIGINKRSTTQGILCEHSMEITSDGLREQTAVNDFFMRWESISQVKTSKEFVYICKDVGYYAIPKRAFSTEKGAEDFYQEAVSFWKNSRGK